MTDQFFRGLELFALKAGALGLVLAAVSGCQASETTDNPKVSIEFARNIGLGLQRDIVVATYVAGPICLTGPGEARIISVTPVVSKGGAKITDFSVFPFDALEAHGEAAESPKRLSDTPAYTGTRRLSERCSSSEAAQSQLAVELSRPSVGATATALGVRITFDLNGRGYVESNLTLALCSTKGPPCPESVAPSGTEVSE